MFGPHEAWLSLGAIAFYLADSMVFLYSDELLLERVAAGWRPRRGAATLIARRRPCLPNPLTPYRPLLQLSITGLFGETSTDEGEAGLRPEWLIALAPLQILAVGLLALFAVMPVVLYCTGTGPIFLGWMGCTYLLLATLGIVLWRRRSALGLSRSEAAKLAFEAIACPPFAINIVRRVTKRFAPFNLARAQASLDLHSYSALKDEVDWMLAEQMTYLDPATPAAEKIAAYQTRLQAGDAQ